jgi:hypothetical protein
LLDGKLEKGSTFPARRRGSGITGLQAVVVEFKNGRLPHILHIPKTASSRRFVNSETVKLVLNPDLQTYIPD